MACTLLVHSCGGCPEVLSKIYRRYGLGAASLKPSHLPPTPQKGLLQGDHLFPLYLDSIVHTNSNVTTLELAPPFVLSAALTFWIFRQSFEV